VISIGANDDFMVEKLSPEAELIADRAAHDPEPDLAA